MIGVVVMNRVRTYALDRNERNRNTDTIDLA